MLLLLSKPCPLSLGPGKDIFLSSLNPKTKGATDNPNLDATSMAAPGLILHTYFRSSSAARLRIALNLKGIQYKSVYVNLGTGEQTTPAYLALNPSGTVPLLVHGAPGGDISIGQSVAALEYLEEVFTTTAALLPSLEDSAGRAFVRELVSVVVADMQPVTSLRLQAAIEKGGMDTAEWTRTWTTRGLVVYEKLLAREGRKEGRFSYGDSPTLADVCLVPALWNATGNGLDLSQYPKLNDVFREMQALEAVQNAHWQRQGDTPAGLKI